MSKSVHISGESASRVFVLIFFVFSPERILFLEGLVHETVKAKRGFTAFTTPPASATASVKILLGR